jgi:hypothetical protein
MTLPPTVATILTHPSNALVVAGIRACVAAGIGVYFVCGNHDMVMAQDDVERHFPGSHWCARSWIYSAGGLYAEHGHQHTLFNASDPTARYVPLGYWISRALTRPDGAGLGMDEVLKTDQPLGESIWEAVCEAAGLAEIDIIVGPYGDRQTVADIRAGYSDVYSEWLHVVSRRERWRRLTADMGQLEPHAERISSQHKIRGVVMGHTHKAMLDRDTIGFDSIYANSGSWSRGSERTWVEAATDGAPRLAVALKHWRDGEAHAIGVEAVG